jgi:hypothetical protein
MMMMMMMTMLKDNVQGEGGWWCIRRVLGGEHYCSMPRCTVSSFVIPGAVQCGCDSVNHSTKPKRPTTGTYIHT